MWPKCPGFVNYSMNCITASRATLIYYDNVSMISTNPMQQQRMKYVVIHLHFVREYVVVSYIRVLHVPTTLQFADIFSPRGSHPQL
jgi:hypothetical protein